MLEEGIVLMLMGMGTVFSFLITLIITMVVTYNVLMVINKIFPEAAVEAAPAKKTAANDDAEIAIAIAAANRL